ncbi:hypothetical protein RRF57_009548 [Xylaria bambusicola]|uniref:PNPLA domain-containing protein n=1 Tax=Xylaria bambusicola TaxID=326684 RepID=A0AAN7UTP9_9PEZI
MQYTVDDAIAKYSELARDVFTTKSKDPKAKYDHKKLEEKIRYVIEKAPLPTKVEAMMKEPDDQGGCCKVFVVTTLQNNGSTPYLMRTYESNSGQPGPGPFPIKIWQAARATSAAPTFFLPIEIELGLQSEEEPRENDEGERATTKMTFGDGGTTANNPSFEALVEYQSIWPWRPLGCLVSLGTGVEEEARIEEDNRWKIWMLRKITPGTAFQADVGKYCAQVATSCEKIHAMMKNVMEGLRWKERYFRLNVKYNRKIDLDEYERVQDMKVDSNKYMQEEEPKKTKQKIGVILVDPESERNRKLDEECGLHGFSAPEFQSTLAIPTSWREGQTIEPESSAAEASDTTANVNQAGPSNNDAPCPEISDDDELPVDLTWPLYSNKLSAIQSVIFYHYDHFGSGWDYTKQPRHGESVLFDRRDQGESAVAVLELRSKASFVSTNFIEKFNIKPKPLPAVSRKALRIGPKEVKPDSYINLTFRCRGFKMPKQRQSFYVLNSNNFEIMFGEDILKRTQLAKHATGADVGGQDVPDANQTVVGNLKAKAQPLIGKGKRESTKGKERDNKEWGPIITEYLNGALL